MVKWGSLAFALTTGWILTAGILPSGRIWSKTPPAAGSANDVQETLQRAITQISSSSHHLTEFDYVMTARVRLLLFWAAKDDVGGGYIREGEAPQVSPEDGSEDMYQIVMGSDPAKAPMAINRWGAAWELVHHASAKSGSLAWNTFVGFMKVSKGTSVAEMQKELAQEKKGQSFLFSAIVNQADSHTNFAKEVPFQSDHDFTIHQLDQAAPFVFHELEDSQGKLRSVDTGDVEKCGRPQGFLSTVAELIDGALRGARTPAALCYFYDGQRYTLAAERVTPVPEQTIQVNLHEASGTANNPVDPMPRDAQELRQGASKEASQPSRSYTRAYHNLLRVHFENINETTRKRSNFDLFLGTQGALRGVPVRISYQPNWWFQVVLNLKMPETAAGTATSSY